MAKLENYVELARADRARDRRRRGNVARVSARRLPPCTNMAFTTRLMIYAQRPDATACASFELWTNTMRRYVRRGAKGIALLDMTGDVPRCAVITSLMHAGYRALAQRRPNAVCMDDIAQENGAPIAAMLEKEYERFCQSRACGTARRNRHAERVMDYWQEHQDELRDIVDGSLLMEYDELNLELAFRNTATTGVQYMLLSRCGLAGKNIGSSRKISRPSLNGTRPRALSALGTAVSEISEEVLRSIEREARKR